MTNLDSILQSRDIILPTKVCVVKVMVFPVVMYGSEKNWCFWTVVLEKTLESPLDCKEIKPVNPKGNQSWIFIGRTDAEAKAPIFWPPDVKSWFIRKDTDAGKDWRQEQKGITEDKMFWWNHQLDGHEFKQALGVDDGQASLTCCTPWAHRVSDTPEQLNWTELTYLGPLSCFHILSSLFSGLTIRSGCSLMTVRYQVFFSFLDSIKAHGLTPEGCNR